MSEILPQDEVDALLKGAAEGTLAEGGQGEGRGVRTVDLTSQERTLRGRLPGLERVVDRFLRAVRPSLGALLGKIPVTTIAGLELIKFARVSARFAQPMSLQLFRMTPLRGQGLLIVPGPLAAALLQLVFGGIPSRKTPITGREFSAIELRALERLGARVLQDLQAAWRPVVPLDIVLMRSETNPLFAAIAAPQDLVMLLDLRVEVPGAEESVLSVCIPNGALDPVRARLQEPASGESEAPESGWGDRLRGVLATAVLDVTADLGVHVLTVREVLGLRVGDVLPLNTGRDGPVVVCVEGQPRFVGAPGVAGANNAVRLTGRL